jgi:hypothetical protein
LLASGEGFDGAGNVGRDGCMRAPDHGVHSVTAQAAWPLFTLQGGDSGDSATGCGTSVYSTCFEASDC